MNVPLDEQKLWHGEQVECLAFNVGSFRDGGNFILHNACWNILRAYFSGCPILPDVLVDSLRLCPEEMTTKLMREFHFNTPKDPSQPLVVHDLLRPTKGLPTPSKSVVQQRMKPHFDTFMILPLDLREDIAVYLRTVQWIQCSSAKDSGKLGSKSTEIVVSSPL